MPLRKKIRSKLKLEMWETYLKSTFMEKWSYERCSYWPWHCFCWIFNDVIFCTQIVFDCDVKWDRLGMEAEYRSWKWIFPFPLKFGATRPGLPFSETSYALYSPRCKLHVLRIKKILALFYTLGNYHLANSLHQGYKLVLNVFKQFPSQMRLFLDP